jgi:hypothetical protein
MTARAGSEIAAVFEDFTLERPRGLLRGRLLRPPAGAVGSAVLSAPFGHSMEDTLLAAGVLVANGLTVVQYDPVDHAGRSDGSTSDYVFSRHRDDLLAVTRRWSQLDPVLVSFGVSAMPTIRALVAQPVRGTVLVMPIVAILQTLATITGRDWRALMTDSADHAAVSSEHEIGAVLLRDPERWAYADEQLLTDCVSVETPIDAIVGSSANGVDLAGIRKLVRTFPNGRVVTVANTEQNPVVPLQFLELATGSILRLVGSEDVPALPTLAALRGLHTYADSPCRKTEQRIRSPQPG